MKKGCDIYRIYIDRSLFVYGYINSFTNRYSFFTVTTHESQINELLEHLEELEMQICFNSLHTEYQLLDDIITSRQLYLESTPSQQLEMLCRKARDISEKTIPLITEKDYYIPQIDLSKLLGLNTAIRTTTISDIAEYFDIIFKKSYDEIPKMFGKQFFSSKYSNCDIMDYLEKSTFAIKKLYLYAHDNLNIINARKKIASMFGLKMTLNMSNIKAGEVLACRLYCKRNGIDLKSFPKPSVHMEKKTLSCIVDSAFKGIRDKSINKYKEYLSSLPFDKDTSISYKCTIGGISVKLGNGGMHGCVDSGIYNSSDSTIIIQDVSSFYASIAVINKCYPSHLNESFIDIYKDILDKRIELVSKGEDKYVTDVLKGVLVGIYGKFKEQQSNLYDSELQIKITVLAQIFMFKWIDCLFRLGNIEFLSINTDGFIIRVPNDIVDKVSQLTEYISFVYNIHIKTDYINKIYIKDVNNYMYISKDSNIVKSGCFDDSPNIYRSQKSISVASAISDYFLYDIGIDSMRAKYDEVTIRDAFKIIYSVKEQQQSLF